MNTILIISLIAIAAILTIAELKGKGLVNSRAAFVAILSSLIVATCMLAPNIDLSTQAKHLGYSVFKTDAAASGYLALKLMGVVFAFLPLLIIKTAREFNAEYAPAIAFIQQVEHLRFAKETTALEGNVWTVRRATRAQA
jgi:hypothetical protein